MIRGSGPGGEVLPPLLHGLPGPQPLWNPAPAQSLPPWGRGPAVPGVPWFSALAGLYPGVSPFVPGMPLHGAVCFGPPGGLLPAASMPHMQAVPLSAPPSSARQGSHAALPCASAPPNLREQRSDTPAAAAPSSRPDVSVTQRGSQTKTVQFDRKPAGVSATLTEAGRSAHRKRAYAGLHAGRQALTDNPVASAWPTSVAPKASTEMQPPARQPASDSVPPARPTSILRPQAVSASLSGSLSNKRRSTADGARSDPHSRSAVEVANTVSSEYGHSLVDKHREGSATSDEVDHPKLIPKAGAGPALRSDGGREIDEYLMRLLRIGAASDLEARVYTEGKRAALEHMPPHTANSPRPDSGSAGRRSSKASHGQPGSRTVQPPPVVVAAVAAQALHDGEAPGRERPELDNAAAALVGVMGAGGRSASLSSAGRHECSGSRAASQRPAEPSQPPVTHSGSSQHAIAASVDLGDLSGQSTPERSSGEPGARATGGASAPRRAGRGTESMSPTPSPPPVLVSGDSGSTERPAISEWRGAPRLPAISELQRLSAPADGRRRGSGGTGGTGGSDEVAAGNGARAGRNAADSRLRQGGGGSAPSALAQQKSAPGASQEHDGGGLSGSQAGGGGSSKWRSGSMDPPPPKPPRRHALGGSNALKPGFPGAALAGAQAIGCRGGSALGTSGSLASQNTRFVPQLTPAADSRGLLLSGAQSGNAQHSPLPPVAEAAAAAAAGVPGCGLGSGAAESRREPVACIIQSPSDSARLYMGDAAFDAMRRRMREQSDLFHAQLLELHRLADVQLTRTSEAAAAATAAAVAPPSAPVTASAPASVPLPVSAGRGGGPWFAALMQQWQASGLPPLGLPFSPGLPPLRFPGAPVPPLEPVTAACGHRMGGGPPAVPSVPNGGAHSPVPFAHPALALHQPPFGGWWGAALPNPYAAAYPAFPVQSPWQQPVAVPAPPHAWVGSGSLPGPDTAAASLPAMMARAPAPVSAAVPVTDANYDVGSSEANTEATPDSLVDAADFEDGAAEPRTGGAGGLAVVDEKSWQHGNGPSVNVSGTGGKRSHAEACVVAHGAHHDDGSNATVAKRGRMLHA